MAKRKGEKGNDGGGARPADPETEEKKRLRSLAFSQKLLRRTPAEPSVVLPPSKAVVRLQGRDITKRGQRKSRYLFSFPGLLAPVSGGKIGELGDLATKNPVLYLDFPQGRMKLFGTHVYPKNKYLTLQLTKSSKGVMVEDVFESMIVFSEAWWIGTKEENPHELQLQFPKFMENKDSSEHDFKGGAGATFDEQLASNKPSTDRKEPLTPDDVPEDSDSKPENDENNVIVPTPTRQSARTSGKKLSYVESSPGEDEISSDADTPEIMDVKTEETQLQTLDNTAPELAEKATQSSLLSEGNKGHQAGRKGGMVQTTLSTLFEKAENKRPKRKTESSPGKQGTIKKRQKSTPKQSAEQVQVESNKKPKSSGKRNGAKVVPSKSSKALVDIEEISSGSEAQELDDSDEDWIG